MWISQGLVLAFFLAVVHSDSYHDTRNKREIKSGIAQGDDQLHDWEDLGQRELQEALDLQRNMKIAKNVILFIGDGMGISTISAARIFNMQMRGKTLLEGLMSWEQFPHVGISRTYTTTHQTADSAATATAFLVGQKTTQGTIGVGQGTPRGNCAEAKKRPLKSILKHSQDKKKSVGIVTTTRVTHATPASAYAHSPERDWEGQSGDAGCKDIARQLVEDNPDIRVILGGGRMSFVPKGTKDPESNKTYTNPKDKWPRKDNKDLIEVWKAEKRNRSIPEDNFKYVDRKSAFDAVDPANTDFLFGLFEPSHMAYEADRQDDQWGEPSLAEMTKKAIQILSKNNNGFFLEVEGGRIDHAHHDTNAYRGLMDTLAFSDAVEMAVNMTSPEETLIVVTADHSHTFTMGGYPVWSAPILGLAGGLGRSDNLPYTTLAYANGPGINQNKNATTGERYNLTNEITTKKDYLQDTNFDLKSETHGGEDVGIWARGPMAHLFHGSHEQSYIAHVMMYASCVGANQKHCQGGQKIPPDCPTPGGPSGAGTRLITQSMITYLMSTHLFHIFSRSLF